jgi:glutamate-1-semialdehyde 2,1-aminomutase
MILPTGETTLLQFDKSRQRLKEASQYLAGGVSSNFRLGISPTPLVIERGEGALLYDVDGNELVDYYMGMGPIVMGHNPAVISQAVADQARNGLLFAAQSEIEYEAAQLVCQLVPCSERIRFGSSGTEVVQAALRLARAATKRTKIIKFEGHYHGWLDNILWSVSPALDQAGPPGSPYALPGSPGQDSAAGQNIEVMTWNDVDGLRTRLQRGDVAAVIMEPVMCNTSAIMPQPGYLEAVRTLCSETGTILIFDEVITGFRVGAGGAQQLLGVTPDLATFGKAIANGFPVACLAGRANLMDMFVDAGVMHGGTYNAQAVCMAAAVATLKTLSQAGFFLQLEQQGQRLMSGLSEIFETAGIEARIQGVPAIFHLALGVTQPITNYRDSLQADKARYRRLTTALLYRGVRVLERGAWFVCAAHSDALIDRTLEATKDALSEI